MVGEAGPCAGEHVVRRARERAGADSCAAMRMKKEVLPMSNGRDSMEDGRAGGLSSLEQVARCDAFLDQLVDDRRPAPSQLTLQEVQDRQLAAQLRLLREGVETVTA